MRVHHHCVLCIAMTEELFFAYILQTNLQRLHCCISSQSQMALMMRRATFRKARLGNARDCFQYLAIFVERERVGSRRGNRRWRG